MITTSPDFIGLQVRDGIVQADHGSPRRLPGLLRGDRIAIYSPRTTMRGGDPVQCFTALGTIVDDECYQVRMSETFAPWRRRVNWMPIRPASVHPLRDRLSFTAGRANWGFIFRRGLFQIPDADWRLIEDVTVADAGQLGDR